MLRLRALLVFLIVYGSLYPFNFTWPENFEAPLASLFTFNPFKSGLSDSLANVLLFIPLGLATPLRKLSSKHVALVCTMFFLFAFAVQITQLWSTSRIPFGADATWNTFGAFLGVLISQKYISGFRAISLDAITSNKSTDICLLLFFAFLVVDLFPFVPSLDIGYAIANIKKILDQERFGLLLVIKNFAFYTLVIFFAQQSDKFNRPVAKLAILLPVFAASQIFIINNSNDINTAVGLICSIITSPILIRKNQHLLPYILSITLICANGLGTFEFTSSANDFNIIPFAPALGSNTLTNIFAFLEKGLYYSAFTYLAIMTSRRPGYIITGLPFAVICLELFQIHIAGSTPDITEFFVCIFVVLTSLKLMATLPQFYFIKDELISLKKISHKLFFSPPTFSLIVSISCIFVFQYWFMGLSGLPYNVAEMYVDNGSPKAYFFTSVSIVLFGFGIGFIAYTCRQATTTISSYNFNKLVFKTLCIIAFAFLLLRVGITREAIADINGSSNITWQLTGDRILGSLGIYLVNFVGRTDVYNTSQLIEPVIRFSLLFGPLGIFLVFGLYITNNKKSIIFPWNLMLLIKIGLWLIIWLFVCKLVSFDYSSTDNLNELIERDSFFGLSGGIYLYLLVLLISVVVVFTTFSTLKSRVTEYFIIGVIFVTSAPLSWLLLSNGLEDNVYKYGYTFSGLDFILGGSRSELLSQDRLQFRWYVIYSFLLFGLTTTVAIGRSFRITLDSLVSPTSKIERDKLTGCATTTDDKNIGKNTKTKSTSLKRLYIVISGAALSILPVSLLYYHYSVSDTESLHSEKRIPWSNKEANLVMDHHIHTDYSDGRFTVNEISERALSSGCDVIAITDHTDSKRVFSNDRINDIKLARLFFEQLLIINGVELNAPSYGKQEHINLLVAPSAEDKFYAQFNSIMKTSQTTPKTDNELLRFINKIAGESTDNYAAFYNHPSRKVHSEEEIFSNYLKWENGNLMNAFSGAPGHQKASIIGSYSQENPTVHRWDNITSRVGGVLDQLLDNGRDVFGSLAPSDFHNDKLDYLPCSFSRTHLIAPSLDYEGVFKALRDGTYWGSHGNFLEQYNFSVEVSASQKRLSPGEVGQIEKGELVLVEFSFVRSFEHFDVPLEVEVITNCTSEEPVVLPRLSIPPHSNSTNALIPINNVGSDSRSCYLRSRTSTTISGEKLFAYSNHVRLYVH